MIEIIKRVKLSGGYYTSEWEKENIKEPSLQWKEHLTVKDTETDTISFYLAIESVEKGNIGYRGFSEYGWEKYKESEEYKTIIFGKEIEEKEQLCLF